jgi:hypothetical protein
MQDVINLYCLNKTREVNGIDIGSFSNAKPGLLLNEELHSTEALIKNHLYLTEK